MLYLFLLEKNDIYYHVYRASFFHFRKLSQSLSYKYNIINLLEEWLISVFYVHKQKTFYQGIQSHHLLSIKMDMVQLFFGFFFLYSRFLLVIHFIHISVYMLIPISQYIPPPPLPPPLSALGDHTVVLYVCVSISALQTGSSVPFF